jgi:hypothetical protein
MLRAFRDVLPTVCIKAIALQVLLAALWEVQLAIGGIEGLLGINHQYRTFYAARGGHIDASPHGSA